MKNLSINLLLILIFSSSLFAQVTIRGVALNSEDNKAAEGVSVRLVEENMLTRTNSNGEFVFELKRAGSYTIRFESRFRKSAEYKIDAAIGNNDLPTVYLDPSPVLLNEVVVIGASKRPEKIIESPAAVTVVFNEQIQQSARTGQLAKVLSGNVGIDVLRNGASDFIVNTRGFNSGLNRRVLVLQDGRDVAMPLLGAMEWNSFALPQEDFERVEFIRGPAASLYGANAFNGVILMKSLAPREIVGTRASVLAGDYETYKADVRNAGVFGDFSYKVSLGHSQMLNLINRRDSAKYLEYSGLPIERRTITGDDRKTFSTYGTIRLDYDFAPDKSIVSEFGYSRSGNEAYVFGLGRTFVKETERPYFRLAYNSNNINIHTHYMSRSTPQNMWLLVPNAPLQDDSKDIMFDFQHNFSIDESINVIWGASQQFQLIRTMQTSIPDDVNANFTGVYAQFDWRINEQLKFVGSSRFDYASIHSAQFSPRFSIVYSPFTNHQFRASINRAFQRPNYSELYRRTPDAPAFAVGSGIPVNFANIENRIADSIAVLSGVRPSINFGLDPIRALALGNSNLEVEKIIAYELGYKGAITNNLFISIDLFYNRLNDFITNFLPNVNPNITKWTAVLPDSLAQYQELAQNMVISALSPRDQARLSIVDGLPTFVVSNTNVGQVDEYGLEIELVYQPINSLTIKADYSYFGHKIVENKSAQPLLPNTSPHRINFSVGYNNSNRYDITAMLSYYEGFDWLAGTYFGKVPSYAVVNLNGGYKIIDDLRFGVNIFNLLNRKHYQIFGGTYLPRMATAQLSYSF